MYYFISNCNLIQNFGMEMIVSQLNSIDDAWLSNWFVNSYIRRCSIHCSDNVSSFFTDVSTSTKLQNAVSAVVDWRLKTALADTWREFQLAEFIIAGTVSQVSLTVRSCNWWTRELAKTDATLVMFISEQLHFYTLPTKYQRLVSPMN